MDEKYRRMVDFLVAEGTGKVAHTEKSFLAHLIGVYTDLEQWGCEPAVCRAGMFHSIYGTEPFQDFKLELARRGDVRELIGEHAERLAYLNSAMTRRRSTRRFSKMMVRVRWLIASPVSGSTSRPKSFTTC